MFSLILKYNPVMRERIVALGEVLFDCFPSGERLLGGAPANCVFHACQAGMVGVVVSAVGKDGLSEEAIRLLKEKNLTLCLSRVDYPTGQVLVTVNENGDCSYEIALGSAWDNIPLTPEALSLADTCRAVTVGSLAQRCPVSRATIQAFLKRASARKDCLIVFDINLRQHYYSLEVIEETLSLSGILKINDEELEVVARLMGKEHLPEADFCRHLLETYALEMVILTMGSSGSKVYTRDGVSFVKAEKVDVVSTVGAGDAFTGVFISSLLSGKSVPAAQKLATRAAAFVCRHAGAMPEFPKSLLEELG